MIQDTYVRKYKWLSYLVHQQHESACLTAPRVALGGLLFVCLLLDTRFAGSNTAEDDEFLRVIKSVARLPS
jgi:hypothetical protein